jgi:hypothetical protein
MGHLVGPPKSPRGATNDSSPTVRNDGGSHWRQPCSGRGIAAALARAGPGRVVGVVGVARDIAALEEVREQLGAAATA